MIFALTAEKPQTERGNVFPAIRRIFAQTRKRVRPSTRSSANLHTKLSSALLTCISRNLWQAHGAKPLFSPRLCGESLFVFCYNTFFRLSNRIS
jgi:hypothetical protein